MNEMQLLLLYWMYGNIHLNLFLFLKENYFLFCFKKLYSFRDDLYTLYSRPRLLFPAWYILTQEHLAMSRRRALAQQLCSIIHLFTTPKYGE